MKLPDDERILIVRPCLKTICLSVRPAAKLLSLLLFYARHCDDQEATYTFSCTQEDLIEGLIGEMDVKTLHRIAIPMLRLLGYLDVDGASYRYQYTVHLDLIQHVLAHYKDKKQLDKILIVSMQEQLDKRGIQIDKSPIELVKSPIELDKCLFVFRQMSNSKRGRKPKPHQAGDTQNSDTQNLSDDTDVFSDERESDASANASANSPAFENNSHASQPDTDEPPLSETGLESEQQQETTEGVAYELVGMDTTDRRSGSDPRSLPDRTWASVPERDDGRDQPESLGGHEDGQWLDTPSEVSLVAAVTPPEPSTTVEPGQSVKGALPSAPASSASPEGHGADTMVNGASVAVIPPDSPEAPVSSRTDVQSSGDEAMRQEPQMHVLITSQQFATVDEWDMGKDAFTALLSATWKQASPDFKQGFVNWQGYRKYHLDRWHKANPKPVATLTPEELAFQARCTSWYTRITDWCGGPMTKGGQVINERECFKKLVAKFTDAQLEAIFTYLTTRDWKYSKIDNKFRVRGFVMWEEAGRVAQILREERQNKGKPVTSSTPEPPVIIRPASSVRSFNGISQALRSAAGGGN